MTTTTTTTTTTQTTSTTERDDDAGDVIQQPPLPMLVGGGGGAPMTAHAYRLYPGTNLVVGLREVARQTQASALSILTCVGSLSSLTLRMANHHHSSATTRVHSTTTTNLTTTDINNSCCSDNNILHNNNSDDDHVSPSHCFRTWNEPLEIVSLVGTLAVAVAVDGFGSTGSDCDDDNCVQFHLHMAVADASGQVYGGHLLQATVHTTVELVLASMPPTLIQFHRVHDPATGYRELVVVSSTSLRHRQQTKSSSTTMTLSQK